MGSYSEAKIVALFEKYKDDSEDFILSEGIEEFCIDLQLKPDEFKVLVLAWKFEAEQMCRFSRAEFISGCRALKTDSCRGLQVRLPEVVSAVLADHDKFRDLYRFTYRFGLDSANGRGFCQLRWQSVSGSSSFHRRSQPCSKSGYIS